MATEGSGNAAGANDISFSIGVDSAGALAGLERFASSIDKLGSLVESQAGKISSASSAFEGLGSAFDKASGKASGLLSSISGVGEGTKGYSSSTQSVLALSEGFKSLGFAAKDVSDKIAAVKDIKILGASEINKLLGGIQTLNATELKEISTGGSVAFFDKLKNAVAATDDQIKAFGSTRVPDVSSIAKGLSGIDSSGIIAVTNEFIKLESVIIPTVEQLKLAVAQMGSLKNPNLSSVSDALRSAQQTPFSAVQPVKPRISVSDIRDAAGVERVSRTPDIAKAFRSLTEAKEQPYSTKSKEELDQLKNELMLSNFQRQERKRVESVAASRSVLPSISPTGSSLTADVLPSSQIDKSKIRGTEEFKKANEAKTEFMAASGKQASAYTEMQRTLGVYESLVNKVNELTAAYKTALRTGTGAPAAYNDMRSAEAVKNAAGKVYEEANAKLEAASAKVAEANKKMMPQPKVEAPVLQTTAPVLQTTAPVETESYDEYFNRMQKIRSLEANRKFGGGKSPLNTEILSESKMAEKILSDPNLSRKGRESLGGGAPSSSAGKGKTANVWADLENIVGMEDSPILKKSGKGALNQYLKDNYNPEDIKAAAIAVKAEMLKLQENLTVPQRVTASKIPFQQRQESFLTRGTGYTPAEELRLYEKDRKDVTKEKERIDKAEAAKQAKKKKEQEKYEEGGGFMGKYFGAFFGGSAVPSFTGLGGVARALNQPFLASFGTVGLLAQGLVGVVGSVFSTIGSIASTVANVILGVFKAAFIGISAVGAIALAGLGAGFLATKKLVESTFAAFDKGKSLSNLSDQTGVAVGKLLQLEKAFKAAGIRAEAIGPTLNTMARTLYAVSRRDPESTTPQAGAGGARGLAPAAAIKGLGLNARELAKMPEEQAFLKIGSAIDKLGSPMQRAAASMAIFRGHGSELLALFANSGAMELVTQKLSNTNQILADRAGTFRVAAERLEKVRMPTMKEGLGQIGVGIADTVVGEFLKITAASKRIDFSSIGQAIGQEFGLAMEAFNQGKMLQYLKDSLTQFSEFAREKLSALFSQDTSFASGLIAAAIDFGQELLVQLDNSFASTNGGLVSALASIVDGLSNIATIMIGVAETILSATAGLGKWAEKAALLVGGVDKKKVETKDVVGGAVIGGVALAGLATLLSGGVALPLLGLALGAAGGAGLGAMAGATGEVDTTNKVFTDENIEKSRSALAALAESLKSGNAAVNSNIQCVLAEAKERADATAASKKKNAEDAADRRQVLAIDKAKVDYAQAKKQEEEFNKKTKERTARIQATGEGRSVVADSMREIGGGGRAFIGIGADSQKEDGARVAENTQKTAEYLRELLAKLGGTQQGPTQTGKTLDWANMNPIEQRKLERDTERDKLNAETDKKNTARLDLDNAFKEAKKIDWTVDGAGGDLNGTEVGPTKSGIPLDEQTRMTDEMTRKFLSPSPEYARGVRKYEIEKETKDNAFKEAKKIDWTMEGAGQPAVEEDGLIDKLLRKLDRVKPPTPSISGPSWDVASTPTMGTVPFGQNSPSIGGSSDGTKSKEPIQASVDLNPLQSTIVASNRDLNTTLVALLNATIANRPQGGPSSRENRPMEISLLS